MKITKAIVLGSLALSSTASADIFTLQGTFTPNSVEPTVHTLSGTFEVVHGVFTAADISVSGFATHFTLEAIGHPGPKDWFLRAVDFSSSAAVGFHIIPDFETYTSGFIGYQHGIIIGGYLDGTNFVQHPITGTFTCAEVGGCERLPVPGPTAGSLSSLINLFVTAARHGLR